MNVQPHKKFEWLPKVSNRPANTDPSDALKSKWGKTEIPLEAYQLSDPVNFIDQHTTISFKTEGHQLDVPFEGTLIVGRASASDKNPDVDLSKWGFQEADVSAWHFKISSDNRWIYIADLDSPQGTILNDYRLVPFREYVLVSGDIIMLGSHRIKIRF